MPAAFESGQLADDAAARLCGVLPRVFPPYGANVIDGIAAVRRTVGRCHSDAAPEFPRRYLGAHDQAFKLLGCNAGIDHTIAGKGRKS